jgi:hypothetical protein
MIDPCLQFMLNTTITVKSVTAVSASGQETLGPARTWKAYVELRPSRTRTGDGAYREQSATLIVTDAINQSTMLQETFTIDDRIWLEGDDSSVDRRSRRAQRVVIYRNPIDATVSHYEAEL